MQYQRMIKRNCKSCNKEFGAYPSKIALGRGKYCSRVCSMPETNKILEMNGKETRFQKGQEAHNKVGFMYSIARKGGKAYKLIFKPEHPFATMKGYVREHRLVMEESLGRFLEKDEMVHHINGDTLDNKVDNLQVMSGAEHRRFHLKDSVHKRWINRLNNTTALLPTNPQ